MLSPEYLLRISEGGEYIAESLHNDIISKIVERIAIRLGRGDNYILTAQDKWQLEVLQEAGYLREDIEKILAQKTGLMQTEIAEAMEDACVQTLKYDDEIYRAAGLEPGAFEQSPHMVRLAQRAYEATNGEFYNFTRTMAEEAQRSFIQACDKAYIQVSSGALGYAQAFAEAINGIVSGGVIVTYPSGHRDTIETATLRCIRTGVSQATAQITDARMEEMDWDIILVSSHLGARVTDAEDLTNHFWWQGKFYSKSGKDPRFPPFSVCGQGNVQGIHGANCRHSHGPGDGEFNPYEQYDSEENRKEFELQQRQSLMERRIRDSKRKCMGLKEGIEKAADPKCKALLQKDYEKQAVLLQNRNTAYNQFCQEHDLKKLNERIAVAQWDRKQAAQARAAARRAEKYDQTNSNNNQRNNNAKNAGTMSAQSANTDSVTKRTPKPFGENYIDITGAWYPEAKPNSHQVKELQEYTVNGVTYKVDGHNVQMSYSPDEKAIAELLEREVGGEIFMVPRVNNPQGIKTPDYLFHGKGYDLKTLHKPSGKNPIFNRIQNAKGQSRNFILDLTDAGLDEDTVKRQMEKVFTDKGTEFVEEVVIIQKGKIVKVLKRRKKS